MFYVDELFRISKVSFRVQIAAHLLYSATLQLFIQGRMCNPNLFCNMNFRNLLCYERLDLPSLIRRQVLERTFLYVRMLPRHAGHLFQ